MAHIAASDANAWVDGNKLSISSLDAALEAQVSAEVLAKIGQNYVTTMWVDNLTTPPIVIRIIAMTYVGWYYQRTFSDESEQSNYGLTLIANAQSLMNAIQNGALDIPNLPIGVDLELPRPGFYPDDNSSSMDATTDDMSLGPAKFSMGQIF